MHENKITKSNRKVSKCGNYYGKRLGTEGNVFEEGLRQAFYKKIHAFL